MKENSFSVEGRIIDVVSGRIFPGTVQVSDGKITTVKEEPVKESVYILPGLIDAHIHIESSMLIPSEFARLAVIHGTVATVSDPHEIANVLGVEGIRFMIANGKKVPFKFYFGASSCVPATPFETAGASLGVDEIDELLQMDEIGYLSEMMNFPGVLMGDVNVMAKLALARKYGKPVDGHAPGLMGEEARKYIQAGISTDHECFTLEEGIEKAKFGMNILIREGSAARNFDTLAPLLDAFPDQVMFCSDDRHPDDLLRRHINDIARRAILKGYDPISVIKACTLNP
ncbi:MAG: amidohydrolase family protein, partial [Bacteroidales bacterium]